MGELTVARPDKIKSQPRPIRLYAYVNEAEESQIREAADLAGLKVSIFMRQVALAQQIRPARSRQAQELVKTLSLLGADLNRVGNNINQLAYQANIENFPKEQELVEAKAELDAVVRQIVDAIKEI